MLSVSYYFFPNGDREIRPPPAIMTNPRISMALLIGSGFAPSKLPVWIIEYTIKTNPINITIIPHRTIFLIFLEK